MEALAFDDGTNYQHFWEAACGTILPKYDPATKEVIHPCSEMCWDFINGFWLKWLHMLDNLGSEFTSTFHHLSSFNMSQVMNCDYLPSIQGSIPCFYKPVRCDSPPDVTNDAALINVTKKNIYDLNDVVQYACIYEVYKMRGNSTITCLYSGEWSHPLPKCIGHLKTFLHPLLVVLPVLIIPLVALLIMIIKFKTKSIFIQVLARDREFDAFVCYKFDTDNDYVVNHILNRLEEMCEPPLRLCVHERDFLPGLHIKDNIKDAVTKSNGAIIVMSQAFIDSDWCQEEFAHCYLENMKDPAFKIFMIMMQPAECLDNLSEYMHNFTASRTYLSKYDPNLFQKIVSYLHWVKLPKNEKSIEPPMFETCEALLKKQDEEDDLTDSEIEMEYVPSDPFLSCDDDGDDEKETYRYHEDTFLKKDFQMLQFEAEIHRHH